MAQEPRYWPFFLWQCHVLLLLRFKRRNVHISAPGPQIKKLRTLSFLQLLKFEKAKYPYFFYLWPRGQDIGIFFLWRWYVLYFLSFKRWNGHISVPGPQIKEIRTLSFLQLSKFEKAKCPCFYHLLPRVQDIDSFSPWRWYVLHFLSFKR